MPKTIALGLTHPGTVRNRNGDAFYLLDTLVPGETGGPAAHALHAGYAMQFFAVASGIGGHGLGDAAARAALAELETASHRARRPERFDFFAFGRELLLQADKAVHKVLKDKATAATGAPIGTSAGAAAGAAADSPVGAMPGAPANAPAEAYAGASLAVLCLAGDSAYVLSCGDCRCYRLRDGELTQLTDDDARTADPPHQLTSYLGRLAVDRPDQQPRLRQFPLEMEDVFLLTTHGLTDVIDDDALADRLNAPESFTAKPEHLIRQALALNARENLSIVLLRIIDLVSNEAELPEQRYPHHNVKAHGRIKPNFLRGLLVLLASIALGLFAGWILLSLVF